jgi:WD40 repeat protein
LSANCSSVPLRTRAFRVQGVVRQGTVTPAPRRTGGVRRTDDTQTAAPGRYERDRPARDPWRCKVRARALGPPPRRYRLRGGCGPLTGRGDAVGALAFSPDGTLLATGGYDGALTLWNLATGRAWIALGGHSTGPIESMAFSPDGQTLLTAGVDRVLRHWDTKDSRLRLPDTRR